MILIIAFGNDLREDDGAGLVLAGLMQKAWQARGTAVRLVAVQQLMPELAVDITQEGVAAVVFCDTRIAQSPDDCKVTVTPVAGPGSAASVLGHRFDPGLVLAYATSLSGNRVPPAWLVTVPGTQFGYGQGLSTAAAAAVARALADQDGVLKSIGPGLP